MDFNNTVNLNMNHVNRKVFNRFSKAVDISPGMKTPLVPIGENDD